MKDEKPYVLVTVFGGVASVAATAGGAQADIVDWDEWETEDPTKADIRRLRKIERLLPEADKRWFKQEVDVLEAKGVAG